MPDDQTTPVVATRLPLEMHSAEGGAFRIYARAAGRLTIECESKVPATVNMNHLDRASVVAVRDAMNLWLEDFRNVV